MGRHSWQDLLLYVHVPFCRSKCHYCSFFSLPFDHGAWKTYFQALLGEIRAVAEEEQYSRVVSIAFGGGTPSLMPLQALETVLGCIQASFSCARNLEVTFEANPDSAASQDFLHVLKALGITRLSLGLQSLNQADLQGLGRRHSAARGLEAVRMAKAAGFEDLNLDLLFGLPGQSPEDWLRQLELACSLEPSHLSCYALTPEPGTKLWEQISSGRIRLPEEQDQAAMFIRGSKYLAEQGFEHYEISNFARRGRRCRHNLGYWQGQEYLGLGPGAVSCRFGRRRHNPQNLSAYTALAESGDFSSAWVPLKPEEQANELAMLRLRTSEGLNLETYRCRTGRDVRREKQDFLYSLQEAGLLLDDGQNISLSRQGMLVSNSIIAELFQFC